ncbi:pilus assembly protein [Burkholderia thailandensis]|uniref:TPR repeat family protein n=1 Tax=Burkholderia thailandensis TaxID=57975 RepID=A0AAW9D355_BURTH|nr:tetratricopeptide repeat protein [Burkholderia thailandensis]MCS3391344.1 pilus assembly protein [Burkholderia thailandensis]MCS6423948.1 pilus assembly protein [Burkholderia thailandensis]MCS6452083.1 pilus assembly protein [Burkholderia thailandensis]MCS6463505.1 pilus assembly protein [Burkholderia thailandensis]MCS6481282.1 pilus assembly protein [Burkholderia thailandensis]
MRRSSFSPMTTTAALAALALSLAACGSFKESGYGIGAQAERAALMQAAADKNATPDTPGMYLGLIGRMQSQGLYYASLAHIDAYEKQYGVSPDTILLRADALRATDQPAASTVAYKQLLGTPLAARGYRGLGLLAGASGDFDAASQALAQASALAPTDSLTLSDLAYARMRGGDIGGARVPLMKAAELDQNNPKILSNLALFLLATGQTRDALGLMNQLKLAPAVRAEIRNDATKIAAASRARQRALARPGAPGAGAGAGVGATIAANAAAPRQAAAGAGASAPVAAATASAFEPTVPLLQRFSQ